MSMKNSNDTIGNRTSDLPVCSAVPLPLRHRALLFLRVQNHFTLGKLRQFLALIFQNCGRHLIPLNNNFELKDIKSLIGLMFQGTC
jgi:hypothetical protein